jgi:hypothetical protein
VVPPEDPEALKETMRKRVAFRDRPPIENPPRIEENGKRAELKRLFDIETSVDRFLADYK